MLGCVAACWAFLELQWRMDERWADESWPMAVCIAQGEVEADEARWR